MAIIGILSMLWRLISPAVRNQIWQLGKTAEQRFMGVLVGEILEQCTTPCSPLHGKVPETSQLIC